MIKVLLIILILNLVSFRALANSNHLIKAQIGVGFARDEIQTTASNSTIASNKSYNQLEITPQLNYFLNPNFTVGSYYFYKSFMANITSSGLGAYGRYYFKSINTVLSKKLDNKNITLTPTWTPYAQLGAKTETLEAETVSISFSGLEAGAGVDWHLTENYFLNFALNLSFQLSGDTRTLNSQSFLIAFGKALNF